MRKIPHPVERKILQPLVDSDHEVMLRFQDILSEYLENKEIERDLNPAVNMVALIKDWINGLQEMYDKAERFDDVENNMYWINDHLDEIDNIISHIRNQSDV